MLKLIAAVAADGGLGNGGALPWHIPEDLARFKALTLGHTVIMGRKTLDSLPGGRPLPGRRNLVLTRDARLHREGAEICRSPEELLQRLSPEEEAWVIGGASVYTLLLPLCDRLELTELDDVFPADCFFPPLGENWVRTEVGAWKRHGTVRYRFCRWEKADKRQTKKRRSTPETQPAG